MSLVSCQSYISKYYEFYWCFVCMERHLCKSLHGCLINLTGNNFLQFMFKGNKSWTWFLGHRRVNVIYSSGKNLHWFYKTKDAWFYESVIFQALNLVIVSGSMHDLRKTEESLPTGHPPPWIIAHRPPTSLNHWPQAMHPQSVTVCLSTSCSPVALGEFIFDIHIFY